MTLEEAIVHLDESLNDQSHDWGCDECKQEHVQLLEWLVELQNRRAADVVTTVRCQSCKYWNTSEITGNYPDGVLCRCVKLSAGLNRRYTSPDDYCCWGERKEVEPK